MYAKDCDFELGFLTNFRDFMLWLKISIIEMIFWPLEVSCMSNDVWELEELKLGVLHFHAGFGTYESSVIIES